MSYPFTAPHLAQEHSNSGYYDQQAAASNHVHYQDSYEAHQNSIDYAQSPSYRDQAMSPPGHDDMTPSQQVKEPIGYHDKSHSPYGPAYNAATLQDGYGYQRKGIWSREDRSSMARRSIPAKIFRVTACVVIYAIIVIISIVCLVVIFARPFNVGVGQSNPPTTASAGIRGNTITFNGTVDFIVSNPNSISTSLTLTANVYDKVDTSQAIGRGAVNDAKIQANSNSTIHFPYQVQYNPLQDKNKVILQDLAQKCGVTGSSGQDLSLSLNIDASIRILSVPVPVSFTQDVSFACPIDASILKSIAGNGLQSLTGRSIDDL